MEIIIHNLKHGVMITVFVFVMMIFIDYLEVLSNGKMSGLIKGGLYRQYIISSFLGSTPGCLGAFMNVSSYMHGLISFGALAGGMIATSGDEAFVMLAMFPGKALLLFAILFVLGIGSAYIADKLTPVLKIKPSLECTNPLIHANEECRNLNFREIFINIRNISFIRFILLAGLISVLYFFITGIIGPDNWDWKRITFVVLIALSLFIIISVPDHYLEEHIWEHIAKKHIWKVFLWTFGALLLVDIGLKIWNIDYIIKQHTFFILIIACIMGIIPESGPHLIIVTMFASDLIPFSILLASSIVQDGHGLLPLLSYSIKDSILIKLINFIIGLSIGLIFFALGY